jgi:hypothetical protein
MAMPRDNSPDLTGLPAVKASVTNDNRDEDYNEDHNDNTKLKNI